MKLRTITLAEARRQVTASIQHAPHEQIESLNTALRDLEIRDLTSRSRELGGATVRKRLAEMAGSDRLPSDRFAARFWYHVFRHANEHRDVRLYAAGVRDLRARFGDRPDYRKALKHHQDRLDKLRRTTERKR